MLARAARAVLAVGLVLLLFGGWLRFELEPPAMRVPSPESRLAGVTVVEPGRPARPDQTIVIERGRIVSIEATQRDESAGVYAGHFVLPGLIDMHVHHPPDTILGDVELFGMLFLAHGVTSVRDTGNFDGTILDSRERVDAGEAVGPRIFACGPILDGAPPFWSGSRVVESAREGRQAVRELRRDGVDCIKVYDRLSAEALAAIREAAELADLPVIGHVPTSVGFREAALDDVQHLTGLLEPGEKTLTDARLRSIVTTSAVLDIAHTPTLVTWERTGKLSDYERLRADPDARALPRYFRDVLWNPRNDPRFRDRTRGDWEELADAPENARRVVRRLHQNGIRLLLGTDTMAPFLLPGLSLHQEMRELEKAGLRPEEIWAAGTWQAGEILDEPGLGRIVAGAPADLLVFREDPSRTLDALPTLEAVVAAGRLYRVDDLREGLARRRVHFEGALVDGITTWLAAQAATGGS